LVLQAQVGYDFPIERLSLQRGVSSRCVREGRAILLANVNDDPEYVEAAAGVHCEVAVPIFVHGVAVGALNVESGLERQLGPWDLALIELFSQQVGVALANITRYEEAVERATVDPVTGLPNHRALMESLSAEVAHARANGAPLALLFFDLDRFKLVNDAFGHRFGDDVLAGLGRFLRERLPAHADLARYGGEEFAALLPATSVAEALAIAEQVRAALAAHTLSTPTGHEVAVTVSVGVAGLPDSRAISAEALIDAADLAMYAAKRLGRNRVVRWTPDLGEHPTPHA
jgi:diguanylate cyclase (GGDEF)-like protein